MVVRNAPVLAWTIRRPEGETSQTLDPAFRPEARLQPAGAFCISSSQSQFRREQPRATSAVAQMYIPVSAYSILVATAQSAACRSAAARPGQGTVRSDRRCLDLSRHASYSSPLVLGSRRAMRSSLSHATRSARANALNSAST